MPKNNMALRRFEDLLFFLTILLLPTQLGRHFWPDFSYIYSLKVDYLSPTLYFWDILVAGLLMVWILQKPHINKIALNLVLLFLFTQALSLLGTSNIGAGLVRLEQYTITGFFGVFLASFSFGDLIKKISLPLALAVTSEAVIAGAEFIRGSTTGLWILGERSFSISTPGIAKFDFYGYEFLRPYATFPHPNVLAGFMLLAIVILNNFLCHSERLAKNLTLPRKILRRGLLRMTIDKIPVFLAGLTIFLTMSRTAILAGFLSAAVLIRRKWLVFMGVLILVLSPILFTRFSAVFSFDSLTLSRREELMGSAWQIFLKSPFYGIGLNNFIPAMASQLVTGPSRFLQPVHNIFLLTLAETGLIGLVGLIGLIGIPVLKLIRLYPKPYALNPILPWFIILFLGMFDHYFLTLPQGYRILFLAWGLSLSMLK